MSAIVSDPVNIASMMFGSAGAVRGASTTLSARLSSVGKVAATEGVVGMVAESTIQPHVYSFKNDIDSPYTLEEAFTNVAFAGLGGVVFGGALEGGAQAFDGLLSRMKKAGVADDPDTKAARHVLESFNRDVETNPFPTGFEFELTHARSLDEATAAAVYGKPFSGKALNELRQNHAERIREFIVLALDPDRVNPAQRKKGKPSAVWHSRMMADRATEVQDAIKQGAGKEINLEDVVHKMDEDGVRHALKSHAKDTLPLKPKDLEMVPDIVRTGEIVKADLGPTGQPGIEYRVLSDGDWLHVHEEVRKKVLTFTTAYRKPGPKTKPGPEGPSRSAPERGGQENSSVSQLFDADKDIIAPPGTPDNVPVKGKQTPVTDHWNHMEEAQANLDDLNIAELDRLISEQGDFDVPLESFEVDGEMLPATRSVKELMEEANTEIEAAEAFQACLLGKGK